MVLCCLFSVSGNTTSGNIMISVVLYCCMFWPFVAFMCNMVKYVFALTASIDID